MNRTKWPLIAIGLLGSWGAMGQGTYAPTPPLGKLWEMQEDGDAYQKDLGFVLPVKWKEFSRQGFSSGREDGASEKATYLSADGDLRLSIWIQLRLDVRGVPFGPDQVWDLLKIGIQGEMSSKPVPEGTELSSAPFGIGKRTPLGRQMWTRYPPDSASRVQGAFWQNIGVWAVVVTLSGPEARREELEKYSQALFAEMPFPYAPLATELAVNGEQWLAAMPKCKGARPEGAGKEIVPTFPQAAAMTLLLTGMLVGQGNQFVISPVTQARDYCVIETFKARDTLPVTAIEYRGAPNQAWEPRYGFALNNGRGGYYQLERMPAEAVRQATLNDVKLDQVFLNFSNNKRGAISGLFDDWPSYEAAKQAIITLHKDGMVDPIINVVQTAERRVIVQNPDRVQKLAD